MNRKEIRISLICTVHFHCSLNGDQIQYKSELQVRTRSYPSGISSTLHTKHHTSSGLFTGVPHNKVSNYTSLHCITKTSQLNVVENKLFTFHKIASRIFFFRCIFCSLVLANLWQLVTQICYEHQGQCSFSYCPVIHAF